jgi:hypothetical protein
VPKWIAGLFVAGALWAQNCPASDAESAMLLKRITELSHQIDQMNMRAALLRLQIAQKEQQVDFYMACAYAGIIPDGACEVNVEALTVTRKDKSQAQEKQQ